MEVEAETRQRCFKEERSAIKLGFDQESGKMKTEMEAEVQAMRRLSEEKTESQRRLHEEEKSLLVCGKGKERANICRVCLAEEHYANEIVCAA